MKAYEELIGTEAGLITGNFLTVPPRNFVPKGLHIVSCQGDNLEFSGLNTTSVNGSSIEFDPEKAYMACLGEYFERYCASHHRPSSVVGTYHELQAQERILHPDSLKLYADWQYETEGFPYQKLTPDLEISWTRGRDLNDNTILVPSFMTSLSYLASRHDHGIQFTQRTSTGLAAGSTAENAIKGGFLEAAERNVFCNFWYNQRSHVDNLPIYDAKAVLEAYPDEEELQKLYNNTRVKIFTIDLTSLGEVSTVVTVMLFPYKGKIKMSLGCSSRFIKPEALKKSILEAYQGVEYIISLEKRHAQWLSTLSDLTTIDDFGKHFVYYNAFPEQREQVPIFQRLFNNPGFSSSERLKNDLPLNQIKNMEEARQAMGDNIIVVDMAIPEISELGFIVKRVLVPGWAYLTASHGAQYLGADIFKNREQLFTALPHPFP